MNIAFFGDNRSARNFGSIATTEALFDLIERYLSDPELRIFDNESCYVVNRGSRVDGVSTPLSSLAKLKAMLRRRCPELAYLLNKGRYAMFPIGSTEAYVPTKFSDFESFFAREDVQEAFKQQFEAIREADLVIVNGEGSLVRGVDNYGRYLLAARYLLFMMWAARARFAKPTYIINHTVDPGCEVGLEMVRNVYPMLDGVVVRESASKLLLEANGIQGVTVAPDALFSYQARSDARLRAETLAVIKSKRRFVCVGDSSAFIQGKYNDGVKWDVEEFYVNLFNLIRKFGIEIVFVDGFSERRPECLKACRRANVEWVSLNNCSYHELYWILQHADAFFSGRWHASILSLISGTNVVLFGADSHKTRGLSLLTEDSMPFFEVDTLPVLAEEICSAVVSEAERPQRLSTQDLEQLRALSALNVTICNNKS